MGLFAKKPTSKKTSEEGGDAPPDENALPTSPVNGRRLILKFVGADKPELDRIEFFCNGVPPSDFWQRGHPENNFTWTRVPQAFSILFLDYALAGLRGTSEGFVFRGENKGSLAASLGDAIYQPKSRIHGLFVEHLDSRAIVSRVPRIFDGINLHGKEDGERRIFIRKDFLPPGCIEIFWEPRGKNRLTRLDDFQLLSRRLRESLGLPVEPALPVEPVGEGSPPESLVSAKPSPEPEHEDLPNLPELLEKKEFIIGALADGATPEEIALWLKGKGVITTEARVRTFCQALAALSAAKKPVGDSAPPPGKTTPRENAGTPAKTASSPQPVEDSPTSFAPPLVIRRDPDLPVDQGQDHAQDNKRDPDPDAAAENVDDDDPPEPSTPPIPPIDPRLFLVYSGGHTWDDNDPLISFGEDPTDLWRLKDAFEGILILGAPGSGKTSGSGTAFAEALIRAGFGGLVLCVKPGEAQRWQRLCERCGRGDVVVTVNRNGPCLNILNHEVQRPGDKIGLAENLVKLVRVLVEASGRSSGRQMNESFWTNATNQLMRSLFEAFIMAGETLSTDGLVKFLTVAPQKPLKDPRTDWKRIPFFGDILSRGARHAVPGSARVYEHVLDYWTKEFPSFPDKTRSSITLGFTGMADILSGRGIHELVCEKTNITPAAILSGCIVILDLPLKEFGQGGLLVQAAWKHLFQVTVERRAVVDNDAYRYPLYGVDENANPFEFPVAPGTGDRRCPVFLWEDEGHELFSQHDSSFQATCRESRVAHVLISQHVNNFYQLGHDKSAVESLFSLMNTKVFHANGDLDTNQWASAEIGKELKTRFNFTTQPEQQPQSVWDYFKPKSRTSTSTSRQWEQLIRPEEFAELKKGGDGTSEAILFWMSHKFADNGGKPFKKLVFDQEQRT